MHQIVYILLCYLLASIPFGIILTKFFNKEDPRNKGSKSIGATNILRTAGKTIGITVCILDFMKGFVPVILFQYYNMNNNLYFILFICVIGHVFPIYLKFKGGKGVATFLGASLGINYCITIIGLIAWLLIFKSTKISSLSSIIGVFIILILSIYKISIADNIFLILSFALIIFTHRHNIKRLIQKKELDFK